MVNNLTIYDPMTLDLKNQAEECLKKEDYEGYLLYTKQIYEKSQDEEDLENYEKAKNMLQLHQEIQEILKKENASSYDILEIDKDSSLEQIKAAFRQKASRYHPDRAPVKDANDAMRIIQSAYFKINTQEKKDLYDKKKTARSVFNSQYQNPFNNVEDMFVGSGPHFNYSIYTSSGGVFSGLGTSPIMSFMQLYNNLYRRRNQQDRARSQSNQTEQRSNVFIILFFVILAMIFG